MGKRSLRRRLRIISLFTGAGGLDLGFEAAGFRTTACVEIDPTARKTIQKNRPRWNLLSEGNVHHIEPRVLLETAGVRRRQIDVVLGGPPCQPFSKAAFWANGTTARLKDKRADTLRAMLDTIEAALPRAVVIENVRGIGYAKKDEALKLIHRRLRAINRHHRTRYKPVTKYLNAVDYGVPQVRERAFIVAFRDGTKFEPLPPTHGVTENTATGQNSKRLRFATAWDALGDLMPSTSEMKQLSLKGKWARLIPSIPEGENYLYHTAYGDGRPLFGWRTRYWSFLLKLAKDRPSWTLQASPGPATGPFHWDNRALSILEMCRLQTFPRKWKVAGDYAAARQQVGNAVPPALAEAVATSVKHALLGKPRRQPKLKMSIRRRNGSMPAPSAPSAVPRSYLKLVGRYSDHPGPGKGPGRKTSRKKRKKNGRSASRTKSA